MNKIVIEYTEMEQLYVDYLNLENKISECMASVDTLGGKFQEVFMQGKSAEHLVDAVNESNNSLVGFSRITYKMSDLRTLTSTLRFYIEETTNVMKELDEKIKESIASEIASQKGITKGQAREAFDQFYSEDQKNIMRETGMDEKMINNNFVQSQLLEKGE